MSNKLPPVFKLLFKYYDMKVKTTLNDSIHGISTTVNIKFIPKEVSDLSPVPLNSYGVYRYNWDKAKRYFYDMVYPDYRDMPIFSVMGDDTSLDKFLEKIVEEESDKKYREYLGITDEQ